MTSPRVRAAIAGAAGTALWAAIEPFDRRLFRCDYSDLAILGKAFTRRRGWVPLGLALHLANGAAFGIAYDSVRSRVRTDPRRLALALALVENVGLYPLGWLVDRFHPARGEPGIPRLLPNPRAFAQATLRHTVFGLALGRLAN
jgi:hypothetical protein